MNIFDLYILLSNLVHAIWNVIWMSLQVYFNVWLHIWSVSPLRVLIFLELEIKWIYVDPEKDYFTNFRLVFLKRLLCGCLSFQLKTRKKKLKSLFVSWDKRIYTVVWLIVIFIRCRGRVDIHWCWVWISNILWFDVQCSNIYYGSAKFMIRWF